MKTEPLNEISYGLREEAERDTDPQRILLMRMAADEIDHLHRLRRAAALVNMNNACAFADRDSLEYLRQYFRDPHARRTDS